MFFDRKEEKRDDDYSAINNQLRTDIDAQYRIVREKREDKADVVIIRNAVIFLCSIVN